MSGKTLATVVGIVLALVVIIIGLGMTLQARSERVRELELQLINDRDSIEAKYAREIEVLKETADRLRNEIENAPAESGADIEYRYVTVSNNNNSQPAPLPPSCYDCLPQLTFPYSFTNEYVELHDKLRFDADTIRLTSIDRSFKLTDEFNKKLVNLGVEEFIEQDADIFRARWFAMVDYGFSDDDAEPFPGLGIGVGAEFINLVSLTGIEAGVNAALVVVPETFQESHLSVGADWRFFRNTALGAAFGRSLGHNQVNANLIVFPFD